MRLLFMDLEEVVQIVDVVDLNRIFDELEAESWVSVFTRLRQLHAIFVDQDIAGVH